MDRILNDADWSCSADLEKEMMEKQPPSRPGHPLKKNKRSDNKQEPR